LSFYLDLRLFSIERVIKYADVNTAQIKFAFSKLTPKKTANIFIMLHPIAKKKRKVEFFIIIF